MRAACGKRTGAALLVDEQGSSNLAQRATHMHNLRARCLHLHNASDTQVLGLLYRSWCTAVVATHGGDGGNGGLGGGGLRRTTTAVAVKQQQKQQQQQQQQQSISSNSSSSCSSQGAAENWVKQCKEGSACSLWRALGLPALGLPGRMTCHTYKASSPLSLYLGGVGGGDGGLQKEGQGSALSR